jgi:hypothetical protein
MPFIPDSVFGIAYATVLAVCVLIALRGGRDGTRIVALGMVAHWLTMRWIVTIDKDSLLMWMAQDCAMIIVFSCMSVRFKSRTSLLIAGVFFLGLLVDQYSFITEKPFEKSAPAGEAIGYLAMLLMAWRSNGLSGGRRIRDDYSGRHHSFFGSSPSWLYAKDHRRIADKPVEKNI